MKLHVYRYLYLANRGLLQAVNALGELSHEPTLHRTRLRQTQAMIEETRAWMNSDLAEWIEQHETGRASRLDHKRWKRENGKGQQKNEPPVVERASSRKKPSARAGMPAGRAKARSA